MFHCQFECNGSIRPWVGGHLEDRSTKPPRQLASSPACPPFSTFLKLPGLPTRYLLSPRVRCTRYLPNPWHGGCCRALESEVPLNLTLPVHPQPLSAVSGLRQTAILSSSFRFLWQHHPYRERRHLVDSLPALAGVLSNDSHSRLNQ